ncbi:MAG TPA: endo-1,4-beta-xylanase [Blastocatellia bacterium]|nr:endo-1,4-beta-xylanase [Blastocatellia bacterium]
MAVALAAVICLPTMGIASAQNFPLRVAADKRGFYVGAAVAAAPLRNEEPYQDTLRCEFNIIVAENAFKWDAIHPAQGTYNFADTDALVAFAEANHMRIRGHTLVWHNQLPGWLTGGNFTRDEVIGLLRDHISTVMGRYKGRVLAWDVVNEAIDDATGGLRTSSFWYQRIGPDYVRMAFEFAREADPAAKLYYNDYNAEDMGQKADTVYALLRDLKAGGVPVDGVGWQMHVVNGFRITDANRQNAERLQSLGLEMMVTELDVRARLPLSAADQQTQAESYGEVADFCLRQPNCKALVMWGFTDRYSWVPGVFAGMGDALIFDATYQPKPAYQSLQAVLQAGLIFTPRITGAERSRKQLIITGQEFADGAELFLNGVRQKKVVNDAVNSATVLIARKAGKVIQSGDRLQVRNPDGALSNEWIFP